jgi:hypothetical protein
VEPSISAAFPTEPVVLFGSLRYGWNLPVDVNRTIRTQTDIIKLGTVDPVVISEVLNDLNTVASKGK